MTTVKPTAALTNKERDNIIVKYLTHALPHATSKRRALGAAIRTMSVLGISYDHEAADLRFADLDKEATVIEETISYYKQRKY